MRACLVVLALGGCAGTSEPSTALAPARSASAAQKPEASSPAPSTVASAAPPPRAVESPSTPPGFVRYGYGQVDGGDEAIVEGALDTRCGAYRITQSSRASPLEIHDASDRIAHRDAVADPTGAGAAQITPLFCFDLTGDGAPEFLYEKYSGHMHCCSLVIGLSLGAKATPILSYAFGAGGLLATPKQLDDGGSWELVGLESMEPWERNTLSLPVVFSFQKGKYERATRRFTDYVRADRTRNGCPDCSEVYQIGISVLLGEWSSLRSELAASVLGRPDAAKQRKTWDAVHADFDRRLR